MGKFANRCFYLLFDHGIICRLQYAIGQRKDSKNDVVICYRILATEPVGVGHKPAMPRQLASCLVGPPLSGDEVADQIKACAIGRRQS